MRKDRLKLEFLDRDLIERVIKEAYELLCDPGVRIYSKVGLDLLSEGGAEVDYKSGIVSIPQEMVERALSTVPSSFHLYNLLGEKAVHYGGDDVQFDPGSAAIEILDWNSSKPRRPVTADFVRYAKLTEGLEEFDAISTAMICTDVPSGMGDLYRLYLALLYSKKPIVTGAFGIETLHLMKDLLTVAADGIDLTAKPRAIFDACPSSPLMWSDITCENMIDCARYGIPVEVIPAPIAGASGPVTLIGSVVQHTSEVLSGIVIHQLAKAGGPLVWGGSPSILDVRTGTSPLGAVESIIMDCANVQMGKHLGLPTHSYAGMSDSKVLDAQCGFESGIGTVLAAMAHINMISGAGMLAFEECFSLEKLVIDHELIGIARRLLKGIDLSEDPLGIDVIREVGIDGSFLTAPHTLRWFNQNFIPSAVIDRDPHSIWTKKGAMDTARRANELVYEIIGKYEPIDLSWEAKEGMNAIVTQAAKRLGMSGLPSLA